jgi:hypothetical protein
MSVYRVEYTTNNKDDDNEFLDINGVINLISMYEGEDDTLSKVLSNSTDISNNLLELISTIRKETINTEKLISLLSEIEATFEEDTNLLALNINLQDSLESDKLVIVSKEYIDLSSDSNTTAYTSQKDSPEDSEEACENINTPQAETQELLKMIDKTQYAKEMHFGQGNPFEEIQSENIDYEPAYNSQSQTSNHINFNQASGIEQITTTIVYAAVSTENLEQYLSLQAVGTDTKAYDSIDNLQLSENESILEIKIDTSNMIDLTNRKEYEKFISSGNQLNKPLVKRISRDNSFQCIEYLIVDNRAVREIKEA